MNICKMCEEEFIPEDGCETDNICEVCFADDFDGLDLEDKLKVLMKDPDRLREDKAEKAALENFRLIYPEQAE